MKYYLEKEDWKGIVQREYIENNKSRKEVAEILGVTIGQFVCYLKSINLIKRVHSSRAWGRKNAGKLALGLMQCSVCGEWKRIEEFSSNGKRHRSACILCNRKQQFINRNDIVVQQKRLIKILKFRQYILSNPNMLQLKVKYCAMCHCWKHEDEFIRSANESGGLYCYCINCSRKKNLKRSGSIELQKKLLIRVLRLRQYLLSYPKSLIEQIKYCNTCRQWKKRDEFNKHLRTYDGLYNKCKECTSIERHGKYILRSQSTIKSSRLRQNKYMKLRRDSNPTIRLSGSMSASIRNYLKNNKNNKRWESILGYTIEDLKIHLESKFQEGMTWKNYGMHGWTLDHICPVSSFNFTSLKDIEEIRECWGIANLQPLWAIDNIKKGAKLDWKKENK